MLAFNYGYVSFTTISAPEMKMNGTLWSSEMIDA